MLDLNNVFIGQCDMKGSPNGIVRLVNSSGTIYEGNMTSDGKWNGFVI